jgi:hypothetical protein
MLSPDLRRIGKEVKSRECQHWAISTYVECLQSLHASIRLYFGCYFDNVGRLEIAEIPFNVIIIIIHSPIRFVSRSE